MYIALPYIAGDANECNFPYALLHKTCPAFLKKKKKEIPIWMECDRAILCEFMALPCLFTYMGSNR